MVDAILRYLDFDTMADQLKSLGITVKEAADGKSLNIHSKFGRGNTGMLLTQTGVVFTIRLSAAEAALLDDYIAPPNFVCDWRSDEGYDVDGDTLFFDRPKYNIDSVNDEGNSVVIKQGAGRIM
jgi:hypothetical protein